MGDYKMECPGCGSWTNSVGLALRDDQPCPYCSLPADATRLVLAAQDRKVEQDVLDRLVAAERRAVAAETEAADLRRRLDAVRDAIAEDQQ